MSVPTGMNPNTASQYNQVAVQLHNYVHGNNGHQLHSAHGHVQQMPPTHGVAYATNVTGYNTQPQMGAYPGMNNSNVGDFSNRFLRYFFRH
ncbi:hypothetical protein I4U23_005222 [Adineta vaga]|nr:hypothetical protein I4U23_005222 [Adineta vaga]